MREGREERKPEGECKDEGERRKWRNGVWREANSLLRQWIVSARRTPPPPQLTKAHFGDFAGTAEKASVPSFSIFHTRPIGERRLRASARLRAVRGRNRSLGRCAQVQRFESHRDLYDKPLAPDRGITNDPRRR